MAPSVHRQVEPNIPAKLGDSYDAVATAHAALGTLAELLGLYIVLVAATNILPARLRFKRYKPWMRTELALWWAVILIGVGTYYVWYLKPEPAIAQQSEVASQPKPEKRDRVTVTIKNYEFTPQEIEVETGTTVEWVDESGRHSVVESVGLFKSDTLIKGNRFEYKFDKAGDYSYFCSEHGKSTMSGTVRVRDASR
jgi:plastocyanin